MTAADSCWPKPVPGSDGAFNIREIDPALATIAELRIRFERTPLERDTRDRLIRAFAMQTARSGRPFDEAAAREALQLPDTKPPVTGVTLARDRVIWVRGIRETADGTRRWYRLDLRGRSGRVVSLALDQEIVAGDRCSVIVVGHDSLGVPYIAKYRADPEGG